MPPLYGTDPDVDLDADADACITTSPSRPDGSGLTARAGADGNGGILQTLRLQPATPNDLDEHHHPLIVGGIHSGSADRPSQACGAAAPARARLVPLGACSPNSSTDGSTGGSDVTPAVAAVIAKQDALAAAARAWKADPGPRIFESLNAVENVEMARQQRESEDRRWLKFGGRVIETLLETACLVDARYLVALAKAGGVLPRCQELPPSARITLANVWQLRRWNYAYSLPVIVLSYPWLDRDHPDQRGELLRTIAPVLQTVVAAAGDGHCTVGVMIDWCSLPQLPCTDTDRLVFERGLSEMHFWYVSCDVQLQCSHPMRQYTLPRPASLCPI